MTQDEVKQQFVTVIKSELPPDTGITFQQNGISFDVRCSWKLHDVPERKNKPSKTIFVRFDETIVQDCADASGREASRALQNLRIFIQQRLRKFDPKNDKPRGAQPPSETWAVPPAILYAAAR